MSSSVVPVVITPPSQNNSQLTLSTTAPPATVAMTTPKLQEQVVPCEAPLNSGMASGAVVKRPMETSTEDGTDAKKMKTEDEHVSN